jgi:hypothetical protein
MRGGRRARTHTHKGAPDSKPGPRHRPPPPTHTRRQGGFQGHSTPYGREPHTHASSLREGLGVTGAGRWVAGHPGVAWCRGAGTATVGPTAAVRVGAGAGAATLARSLSLRRAASARWASLARATLEAVSRFRNAEMNLHQGHRHSGWQQGVYGLWLAVCTRAGSRCKGQGQQKKEE